MFTITATNTGGTATAYINITIVDEVPTIAYSPNDLSMTNNTASSDLPLSPPSPVQASSCHGPSVHQCQVACPSAPQQVCSVERRQNCSHVACSPLQRTNTGGTATAYINITIVDEVPTIAYSPNDLDLTNNTASSDLPLSPTVTGSGEFVSWAISPSVPSGLL